MPRIPIHVIVNNPWSVARDFITLRNRVIQLNLSSVTSYAYKNYISICKKVLRIYGYFIYFQSLTVILK